MTRQITLFSALAAFVGATIAQGTPNTDSGCDVFTETVSQNGQVYYAAADTDDIGILAVALGSCDAGSVVPVNLQLPDGSIVDCDSLATDGAEHVVSCANQPRGTAQEGAYAFIFNADADEQQYVPFNIVHQQSTSTAATPTLTATTTNTDVETDTITTTSTTTFTSSQTTIVSPAETATNTVTSTPKAARTTSTSTLTVTVTARSFTGTTKTVTTRPPCPTASQKALAGLPRNLRSLNLRIGSPVARARLVAKHIAARDDTPNSGEGIRGDGPVTTTVTPSPTTTTVAAPTDETTTVTITTQATPDASTTVENPTPTTTVFSGTAVQTTTTTLSRVTRTSTAYTLTTKTVSGTRTITFKTTVTKSRNCPPTNIAGALF